MSTTAALSTEEIKRKSMLGAASFFFRTAILQGIGLAAAVVLSALFSPADFGIYGFVIQIIGILTFFSDIGLAAALVQKKSEPTTQDYRTAFTVQQLLSWGIFGIILCLLSLGFIQEKTGAAGVWILLALGISFPLATLKTIPSILLERKLDFSKVVIPQIFEQIVFYSILLWFAWKGLGAVSYAYAIVARSIIGVIVMSIIQPWPVGLALNRTSIRGMWRFGIQFQANDLLARIKDQLFFLSLGLVLPISTFGYIQWAKNWSLYPYNLTVQNVLAITFPTFSRLQHDAQLMKRALEKSIFLIAAAIFPILIGMSVFARPITELFPAYAQWQPALMSLAFFNANVALSAITNPIINAMNAVGKISTTLKLMTGWTTLTWVLTPISLWLFGFTGVAIAAFAVAASSLIVVYFGKVYFQISFWRQVVSPLIAGSVLLGIASVGMQVWKLGFWYLCAGVSLSGVLYAITLALLEWPRIKAEAQYFLRRKSHS